MDNKLFDPKTKVLVVDDTMVIIQIVTQALKSLGYEHIQATNDGEKAWNILSQPDCEIGLIVSDWNMPKMKGIELLKKVRSHPKLKNLPFILLTAENEVSQINEAVQAGVDNYILKPFTNKVFRDKLAAVLKKRKAAAA